MLFGSLLAAGLALSARASAEPSAAERDTARGLMAEGRSDRENGDLQDALRAFLGADAIMHVPTTGLEVARTQAALGLLVEAWTTALRVSRTSAKPGEPAPFQVARQAAAVPEGRLGGARALADGGRGGRAAWATPEPRLSSVPASRPGRREGTPTTEALPALVQSRSRDAGASRALMLGGFGLAGAGLLAGAISGALSLSKTGSIKSSSGCAGNVCGPAEYGHIAAARSMATFSTVSFVAAGVGVVIGVVGLVMGAPPTPTVAPEKPAPVASAGRLRPWVGWERPAFVGRSEEMQAGPNAFPRRRRRG